MLKWGLGGTVFEYRWLDKAWQAKEAEDKMGWKYVNLQRKGGFYQIDGIAATDLDTMI